MIILYGNRFSGHSYKVALFLSLSDLRFEYREIDIFQDLVRRDRQFQERSRYGEVPLLLDGDSQTVQSNAILVSLARRYRRLSWRCDFDRNEIMEWLFWEACRLSVGVANLRFMRCFEPGSDPAIIRHYEDRSRKALQVLERILTGRSFLVGGAPTIADLSCCGYLFWLDETGLAREEFPAVAAWLERIAALPGWQPPEVLLGNSAAYPAPPPPSFVTGFIGGESYD